MELHVATFRNKSYKTGYSVIKNTCIQDKQLSWKARGLLSFLLSLPDYWELNINHLIKQAPDGRDSVYSALKELKKFGYIIHTRDRNKKGQIIKGQYDVHETPQKLETVNTEEVNTNPDTEVPNEVNLLPGKPDLENLTLLNTNSTNYQNNKLPTNNVVENDLINKLNKEFFIIDKNLTEDQKNYIIKTLKSFSEIILPDNQIQLAVEIEYVLLDKKSFTQAENNFIKKLNTIIKQIRNGQWVTPVEMIQKEQKQRVEHLEKFKREQLEVNS